MKTEKNKLSCLIMLFSLLCINANLTFAQWNVGGGLENRWAQTNNQNLNQSIRRVGIGDFSTTLGPRAALNIDANLVLPLQSTAGNYFLPGEVFRTDGPSDRLNAWRLWTGGQNPQTPATEKFSLFVPANSPWVFLQASQQGSRIVFNTGGNNNRMVVANNQLNEPRIGIGAILNPLAYLHIGTDPILPGTGIRNWMNYGTLYNRNTDNMYVGLQAYAADVHDAIINWGNNPIQQAQTDRLRFVFTAATALGLHASQENGLEIARMISNGNDGFTGIGDFLTPGLDPINRLDVRGNAVVGNNYAGLVTAPANGLLVEGFTGIGNTFSPSYQPTRQLEVYHSMAPQLRLSRVTGLQSRFTDFETTSAGNLRINPNDGMMFPLNGRLGINMALGLEPGNTLEITSGPTSPVPSGLRFTNLTANAVPVINPGNGVLTVNNFGDVIYVPTNSGIGTCNPFMPTTFVAGSHGAINLNNENNFYFLGNAYKNINNIGIGYPCASNLLAKLSVLQTGCVSMNNFNANTLTMAGDFWAYSTFPSTVLSVGTRGLAHSPNGQNIGIWGVVSGTLSYNPPPSSDLAGLFQGDVWVSGTTCGTGFVIPSDSRLKKDTMPFFQGLDVIRNIYPINFKYNGLAGFESDKLHQGVVAEQLIQFAPYAVDTLYAKLDSTDTIPTILFSINNDALMFTAINAIKELDSTLTNITAIPEPPLLIAPTHKDTLPCNNLVFTWHKSDKAAYYIISFSLTPDMSDIRWQKTNIDTVENIIGFDNDTTYYWAVKAVNVFQEISPYSEIRSFYYSKTPRIPLLIEPANNDTITKGAPVLWSEVDCASYYTIYVSTTPDETGLIFSDIIYPEQRVLTPMLWEGKFYWWLTCCSQWDICSAPSEIRSFYFTEDAKTGNPLLSDEQLKTDISPITDGLAQVLQLNGKYFRWNLATHPELVDTTQQIGLIAQEVLPIVPEVVVKNGQGFYSIDYARLVSVLIESIKELNTKIEAQQLILNTCCADTKTLGYTPQMETNNALVEKAREATINETNIELANRGAVLYQNIPNPFGDGTAIRYYIPEDIKTAVIVFHNEFGQELKTVEITDKGMGQINITTTNLTAGIYTYSLVVNGRAVDTKKMMRVK